jgi:hypothetical protein
VLVEGETAAYCHLGAKVERAIIHIGWLHELWRRRQVGVLGGAGLIAVAFIPDSSLVSSSSLDFCRD